MRKKKYLSKSIIRRTAFLLAMSFTLSMTGCGKEQANTGRRAGSVFDLFADEDDDPFDGAVTATEPHSGDYEVDPPITEPTTEDTVYADVENQEFNDLLFEFFKEDVTVDRYTYFSFLTEANEYGIEKPERLFDYWVTTSANYEEKKERLESRISKLEAIDTATLTEQQRFDYDYLMNKYVSQRIEEDSYMLRNSFSVSKGIEGNYSLIFADFYLNSKDDFEEYFNFLRAFPEYIQQELDEEGKKVDAGYAPEDATIDLMIKECNDILNQTIEENALVVGIDDALKEKDFLTDKEKENYSKQIREYVEKYYIPAYENMKTTFGSWKGKNKVEGGLCNYGDEGKEYYAYLVRKYTGSNKTPQEMIDYIENREQELTTRVYALALSNQNAYTYYMNNADTLYDYLEGTDPKEIIDHIFNDCMSDYPKIDPIRYNVADVNETLAKALISTAAYYTISRMNGVQEDIIRVNPYSNNGYWGTIAHEGCPGHMYQVNYYGRTNPQPVRYVSMLDDLGYVEGWAVYSSMDSLKYCDFNNSQYASWIAELEEINEELGYLVQSRVDLGLNYEGWTKQEFYDYCTENDLNMDVIDNVYADCCSDPGVILSYGIGYSEMRDMRDYAEQALGDKFEVVEYHKVILDAGPCNYDQLKTRVDKYIAEHK